jgi:hypothetical protein
MVHPTETLNDERSLRQSLHERIDRFNHDGSLAGNQIVRQLQIDQLAAALDAAFDEDRRQATWTPQRVQEATVQYRAEHPYGQ